MADDDDEDVLTTFRKWICRRQLLWTALLALTLVHFVMGALAFPSIEQGSATYYVLLMDFGFIALMLLIIGGVFWRCGYLDDDTPMH
jgi:hypothetical protein